MEGECCAPVSMIVQCVVHCTHQVCVDIVRVRVRIVCMYASSVCMCRVTQCLLALLEGVHRSVIDLLGLVEEHLTSQPQHRSQTSPHGKERVHPREQQAANPGGHTQPAETTPYPSPSRPRPHLLGVDLCLKLLHHPGGVGDLCKYEGNEGNTAGVGNHMESI